MLRILNCRQSGTPCLQLTVLILILINILCCYPTDHVNFYSKFQALEKEIKQLLEKGKKIQDKCKNQDPIPDRLKELLSVLSSLRGTLPGELKNRETYLTSQKTLRKEYEGLVNQFNAWLLDAEKFLADHSAVNIVNIDDALDTHNVSLVTSKLYLVE